MDKFRQAVREQLAKDLPGCPEEELELITDFAIQLADGYDPVELYTVIKRHPTEPFFGCICGYMRARKSGASDRQAILALRVALAMEDGNHEYFTVEDLSVSIGVSEAEAAKMMEGASGTMKVSPAPWLIGGIPQ